MTVYLNQPIGEVPGREKTWMATIIHPICIEELPSRLLIIVPSMFHGFTGRAKIGQNVILQKYLKALTAEALLPKRIAAVQTPSLLPMTEHHNPADTVGPIIS